MSFTRNEIINETLEIVGAKVLGQAANPEDLLTVANSFDFIVGDLQATGAHLFLQNEATLFLQPGQAKYQLGNSSSDHATEVFGETTLSADAAATDTTVSLTDDTGLLAGDNFGIRLDAGTIHWTTVSSLGPLVFTPQLPTGASEDNVVFFYTTDLEKALRVPDARRRDGSGTTAQETEMKVYGREDYLNLPTKLTTGAPTIIFYDPKQLHGEFFIWTTATSSSDLVKFTYYKPIAVYSSASDQGDFPTEWGLTLVLNLSVYVKSKFPGYVMDPTVYPRAIEAKQNLLGWDQEDASVSFQPNYSFGG